MTELEIMQRAKDYIDKLAHGIDPLSGTELPEDTALNQPRLIRCFFYVSDLLRQVIENGGTVGGKKQGKQEAFVLRPEALAKFEPSPQPISITALCKNIAALSDDGAKGPKVTAITDWLVEKGFLQTEMLGKKRRKRVAPAATRIGLFEDFRTGQHGDYLSIQYTPEAQQFVVDNLTAIFMEES